METKTGFKTSEFIALIAGIIATVGPVVLDKVPADSVWAVLLGAIVSAAIYIGGRSYVKGASIKADAIKSVGGTPPNP